MENTLITILLLSFCYCNEYYIQLNGQCLECPDGKTGKDCTSNCPEYTFGKGCNANCSDCMKAGFFCSSVYGCVPIPVSNDCPKGKHGPRCMQNCPSNKFGENCGKTCNCLIGEYCNPEKGCRAFPENSSFACKERINIVMGNESISSIIIKLGTGPTIIFVAGIVTLIVAVIKGQLRPRQVSLPTQNIRTRPDQIISDNTTEEDIYHTVSSSYCDSSFISDTDYGPMFVEGTMNPRQTPEEDNYNMLHEFSDAGESFKMEESKNHQDLEDKTHSVMFHDYKDLDVGKMSLQQLKNPNKLNRGVYQERRDEGVDEYGYVDY